MGFVRVSGYNEDDMAQARAAATAAENTRMKNKYTQTYYFPVGDTGGTKDLRPADGEPIYRYVNAANVYTKGSSDGYSSGYDQGKKDAFDYVTARFITPDVADVREGEGTSYRNFIFGSNTSVQPWTTGQYYTNSYGIQSGKDYLFIMSANCFTSPSEGNIDTYNCNLLSYNYYIRTNQAGNSRVVYLVIHANSSTIGFRGNKESDGRAAIILAYRISA